FVINQKTFGLCDSKIGQLHVPFEGDHDVLETHIAMNDSERLAVQVGFRVGVSQSARDAAGDEHSQFGRQEPMFLVELLLDLFKVHPAEQFHRDEINVVCLPQMVGLNDIRMNEVGDELGLADKIVDELLLVGVALANDLDVYAFYEIARTVLLGFVYDSHAAFINFADNVISELAMDRKK